MYMYIYMYRAITMDHLGDCVEVDTCCELFHPEDESQQSQHPSNATASPQKSVLKILFPC